MNLSTLPHGGLYMLQPYVFRSAVVLVSPPFPFGYRSFQSCLFVLPTSAGELPFCWDCKGRKLFWTTKLFFNFLKLYFVPSVWRPVPLFQSLLHLPFNPAVSSEAGCKGSKKSLTSKQGQHICSAVSVTQWFSVGKIETYLFNASR
jgi:hypothetical protein